MIPFYLQPIFKLHEKCCLKLPKSFPHCPQKVQKDSYH
ncbi:hypothetical protein RV01_GL001360 [Enterococcus dispar]|nr:hypothetical protein RV01_GL001360 [Enterococcus dispar]